MICVGLLDTEVYSRGISSSTQPSVDWAEIKDPYAMTAGSSLLKKVLKTNKKSKKKKNKKKEKEITRKEVTRKQNEGKEKSSVSSAKRKWAMQKTECIGGYQNA